MVADFKRYLVKRGIEQSNSTTMNWFLSGIHNNESFVATFSNNFISYNKYAGNNSMQMNILWHINLICWNKYHFNKIL